MAIFISEFRLWDVEFVTLLSNRNSHQDKQFKSVIIYTCILYIHVGQFFVYFFFLVLIVVLIYNSKIRNPCWFLI